MNRANVQIAAAVGLLLHVSVHINETRFGRVLASRSRPNGAKKNHGARLLIVIRGGRRVADAAPAGAPPRWRYSGSVDGRHITVIAADETDGIVVVTAY